MPTRFAAKRRAYRYGCARPGLKTGSTRNPSGGRFSLASTDTWPQQAALLRDGKLDEFKKLTDELVGGVKK